MRLHTISHASFEKLGAIANWAQHHKHSLSSTNTYKGEKLPDVSQFDCLIIMGGPQSMCESEKYPYLCDEVGLVKQAIQHNKAVLGICLGAQIVGEALGAKTEHSPHKEIGVYPIELTPAGETDPVFKQFPKQFDVMHWHSDMPGIPENITIFATSPGCPRQAFRYGDRVYGLQCHFELTADLVKSIADHCPEDLKPARFVQTADELLKADFLAINQKMHAVLDHLAAVVAAPVKI